jgi:hypothetical protein
MVGGIRISKLLFSFMESVVSPGWREMSSTCFESALNP